MFPSQSSTLSPYVAFVDLFEPTSEPVQQWQRSEELIKKASPNGNEMLLDGKAPLPGQVIQLPNLGKTFRALAEQGKDGFYKGRIAEEIVALIKSKGGVMELEDLAKHETTFVEPIKYTYAGEVTVYEVRRAIQPKDQYFAEGIISVSTQRTRYIASRCTVIMHILIPDRLRNHGPSCSRYS